MAAAAAVAPGKPLTVTSSTVLGFDILDPQV
jgi:hypothetical protein